ncbi:putative permease YjgP/YjgQ family protein [Phycisphaerae bacterium RAS1]|nr:putative permease YjgP/YjgQ family protein [Phycisphaerae bacterium RAS1]
MTTLHGYILRELVKTFLLTLLALTALFSMGGGLFNLLKYEGVTAADVVRVMPMLIPIALTLTMPLAALFAATMTYGRMAADNEFLACKAAGINLHRLFLAVALLGVFVALFTAVFASYVAPGLMRALDHFARTNLRDLAAGQLRSKGYVRIEPPGGEKFLITAEGVEAVSDDDLRTKNFPVGPKISYLFVNGPSFVHRDRHDNLVRFTSAEWGLCKFDAGHDPMQIALYVAKGRDFDIGRSAALIDQQQIDVLEVPLRIKERPSFVDLDTLMQWRREPENAGEIRLDVDRFRLAMACELYYAEAAQRLAKGGVVSLPAEANHVYELSADEAEATPRCLNLAGVRVIDGRSDGVKLLEYHAPRGQLVIRPQESGELHAAVSLTPSGSQNVVEYNLRSSNPRAGRNKAEETLAGITLSPDDVAGLKAFPPAAMIDPQTPMPISEALREQRKKLQANAAQLRRKVTSQIHWRLASSTSAIVTVVMGAVLGLMFRGSRALTAFALAFIPFGAVGVVIALGRQLTEKGGTEQIGPFVIWGGLVLVAVADGVLLRFGVRR